MTITHRVTGRAGSVDGQGKAPNFLNSYSPRLEPTPAGSPRSCSCTFLRGCTLQLALAFVHKAAAIQTQPKTVLSIRPRLTLLPLEAGILTVRYRYIQGLATRPARQRSARSSELCGISRKLQLMIGLYGTAHTDLVRMLPSAAVRLRGTVLQTEKRRPWLGGAHPPDYTTLGGGDLQMRIGKEQVLISSTETCEAHPC